MTGSQEDSFLSTYSLANIVYSEEHSTAANPKWLGANESADSVRLDVDGLEFSGASSDVTRQWPTMPEACEIDPLETVSKRIGLSGAPRGKRAERVGHKYVRSRGTGSL